MSGPIHHRCKGKNTKKINTMCLWMALSITFRALLYWQIVFSTKWLHVPISMVCVFVMCSDSFFEMPMLGPVNFFWCVEYSPWTCGVLLTSELISNRNLKEQFMMFIIIEVRILVYAGDRCVGTWKERTCFLTLCSCSLVRDEHCHSTDQG